MTNPPPAHSNSYSTSSTVRNGSYHSSNSASGNQISPNVKKEPSQLSPVKKRIKETKDHHHYELYRQQQQLQQQDQLSPGHGELDPYGSGQSRHVASSQITIHDTPPLAHYQQQHSGGSTTSGHGSGQRKVPEVITISDSDDESPATSTKPPAIHHVQHVQGGQVGGGGPSQHPVIVQATSADADYKVLTSMAGTNTPAVTTTSTAKTLKVPTTTSYVNNPSSGCPSVMALTPNIKCQAPSVSGTETGGGSGFISTQSTPCASRSHATSCVTVGDSDEDQSPPDLKIEPGTQPQTVTNAHSAGGGGITTPARELNKKTRLLKAQSEWMLSSLKEEGSPAAIGIAGSSMGGSISTIGQSTSRSGPSSSYGSYSRLSVVDEKELMQRYSTSSTLRQDYMEHPGLIYRDARELESRAAVAAVAAAAMHDREIVDRERERDFGLQLAIPPIAHQAEYPSNSRHVAAAIAASAHHSRATVEYINPPVAHSQAVAIANAAQQSEVLSVQRAAAAQLAAAAAHHYRQSSPRAAATVSSADFYAAAAAAAGAPATVYVTTSGYQQIAIPPPPAPPPPAHHSRQVLAPPTAHPLPAHMQPGAAAAAAAAALFPGHQLPQVAAASYGYAPLSPGKTRYLY